MHNKQKHQQFVALSLVNNMKQFCVSRVVFPVNNLFHTSIPVKASKDKGCVHRAQDTASVGMSGLQVSVVAPWPHDASPASTTQAAPEWEWTWECLGQGTGGRKDRIHPSSLVIHLILLYF